MVLNVDVFAALVVRLILSKGEGAMVIPVDERGFKVILLVAKVVK